MSAAVLAPAAAYDFIFGGLAQFRLVAQVDNDNGLETFAHTYKLQRSRDGLVYFAKAVVDIRARWHGGEFGRYAYLGLVSDGARTILRRTPKSELGPDTDEFGVLAWYLEHGDNYPGVSIRVEHRGKCGACGRALSDAESLRTGLGPVCRGER